MPNNSQRGFTSLFLLLFLVFMLGAAYFIWTKQPLDKPIVENFVPPVVEPVKINYMFMAEAANGTLTKVPETEQFRLVMSVPDKDVVYFSDKPEVKTGKIELERFIKTWETYGFSSMNSPKAALTIDGVLNKVTATFTDTLLVTLTDPVFDKDSNTLEFIAQPLSENPGGGLSEFMAANNNFPVRFRAPRLFIDNGQMIEGESYDISNIPADEEETEEERIRPIPLDVIKAAENQNVASDSAMPIEAGTSGSIDR